MGSSLSTGADSMEGSEEFSCRLEDFDYDLPSELIAQAPSPSRGTSRLLVLDRHEGRLEHRFFEDLRRYLKAGDVMVVNDTRVVPARLCGSKETGGRIELLVLDPYKDPAEGAKEGYRCLVKAAKRPKAGSRIQLEGGIEAQVLGRVEDGKAQVLFTGPLPLLDCLERVGKIPLPPYIRRDAGQDPFDDAKSYQTVYARSPGAVAAPTAGLHFSEILLEELRALGIAIVPVTLHVGYGTFAPIRVEDIRRHRMHPEHAEISPTSAEALRRAKTEGRRVIAVGTTVVRILEWVAQETGEPVPFSGLCNHYIYPGYRFRIVDGMVTNFHLPKSTLLLLVSAFAGRKNILNAYGEAIRERYRFYSYGDAMLIL